MRSAMPRCEPPRSTATLINGHNKLFIHDLAGLDRVLAMWDFSHTGIILEDFQSLLDDAGAILDAKVDAVGLRRVLIDIDETELAKEVID